MDKLQFINDDISYLFRQNIVEYDMQSASLAVSERFNLIDSNRLDELKNMTKKKRVVEVGMMQKDKEFSDALINAIIKTRQEFLDMNHIKESNIIALHSDAIIFNNNSPIKTRIDNVEFILKSEWTSYIKYRNVEIYYGDGAITYKGIPREMLKLHTLGINLFLAKVFSMVENNDYSVIKYVKKTMKLYLSDKLPACYYMPFGNIKSDGRMENLNFFSHIIKILVRDISNEW